MACDSTPIPALLPRVSQLREIVHEEAFPGNDNKILKRRTSKHVPGVGYVRKARTRPQQPRRGARASVDGARVNPWRRGRAGFDPAAAH